MFEWAYAADGWASLASLTVMEIVLGVDNIVFISILAARLPAEQRNKARQVGLAAAAISRLLLLLTVASLARLTQPLFTVGQFDVSGKALVLLLGGLFLIWKSTNEIHDKLEGAEEAPIPGGEAKKASSFWGVIAQVMVLDVVFALDSVITAVGMTPHISLMVVANLTAIAIMVFFVNPLSDFVENHPTVKMLALSFLLMIGMLLVAESFHVAVPKGYLYFAMAFSVFVEMLNLRSGARAKPVVLHDTPKLPDA